MDWLHISQVPGSLGYFIWILFPFKKILTEFLDKKMKKNDQISQQNSVQWNRSMWMNECLTTPQHKKQIGYWCQ